MARPTDASGPSPVADAAMARDAGMGYPAVSSVASGEHPLKGIVGQGR
jgi:hypothetical protein